MRAKNFIMPAKKAAAKKTAARKRATTSATPSSTSSAATKTAKKRTSRQAGEDMPPPPPPPAPLVTISGEELAIAAARAADNTKAENILVLDVSGISTITDYFVLCNGTSTPHLKAIARDIRAQLAESHHIKPHKPDGATESHWVVLDYGPVIVHIFHPEKRSLYALEDLWGDARQVDWTP